MHTLHHCNIRSHQTQINTSSQQSDEAGTLSMIHRRGIETNISQLVQDRSGEHRRPMHQHTGQANALTLGYLAIIFLINLPQTGIET